MENTLFYGTCGFSIPPFSSVPINFICGTVQYLHEEDYRLIKNITSPLTLVECLFNTY